MFEPKECAAKMVEQYGTKLATEYASGYASGVWYYQSVKAKEYWRAVLAEIDKLPDQEPKPFC